MKISNTIGYIVEYFHIAIIWFLLGIVVSGYYLTPILPGPVPVPVPPGPTPIPNPVPVPVPIPTPIPNPIPVPVPIPPKPPAPIALKGFSVLIIYESEDLSKYPKEQMNILYDQNVRQLLNSLCSIDSATNTKQYRILDKDVMITDSQAWRDAMSRLHSSLPWVIISNSKGDSFEGSLSNNSQEFISLLNKYKDSNPNPNPNPKDINNTLDEIIKILKERNKK